MVAHGAGLPDWTGAANGSYMASLPAFTELGEYFRQLLSSGRAEPLRLPGCSPNVNAFAARSVRNIIRHECLGRMVSFGERSLRCAVDDFAVRYNLD